MSGEFSLPPLYQNHTEMTDILSTGRATFGGLLGLGGTSTFTTWSLPRVLLTLAFFLSFCRTCKGVRD
jgi:hypothetical protein